VDGLNSLRLEANELTNELRDVPDSNGNYSNKNNSRTKTKRRQNGTARNGNKYEKKQQATLLHQPHHNLSEQ
jgi:hypothetical protein